MFSKLQARYYLFASLILVLLLVFPVREYGSYVSGTGVAYVERYISNWPAQCFFFIASSLFLLLVTITRKKLRPQLISAIFASVSYIIMLLTAITALYFDDTYVIQNGKKLLPPSSLTIWLAVAGVGLVSVFLGNRALIKEIKLRDSENRLR